MAQETAELTLLVTARNAANAALGTVSSSLDGVKRKAADAGRELGSMGSSLSAGLGNLTENLLTGQGLGDAAVNLGAFLAGETVQEFGTTLVAKFAGSALVQSVAGVLGGFGSAIGGFIAAAIPIGMALWPVLLVGAIAAGIAFLIANPQIAGQILEFAGNIVHGIISGIAALPGLLLDFIVNMGPTLVGGFISIVGTIVELWLSIPGKLVEVGYSIVTTIIGGLISLPGKIADAVGNAFRSLHIDIGPFHIDGVKGVTIDLPNITDPSGNVHGVAPGQGGRVPGRASGGWIGLHGPEIFLGGERGPEFVVPNDQLGRMAPPSAPPGMVLVPVRASDVSRAAHEDLYFALRNAGTGITGS